LDTNSSGASGLLDPSQAERLRTLLADQQSAAGMIAFFASHCWDELCQHHKSKEIGDHIAEIFKRQYALNAQVLFRQCESPIETIFFNSFLCSCLKNGLMVIVSAPPDGDFREAARVRSRWITDLFKCFSFYQNLPADARPATFLRFLELTGVERGSLSEEVAKSMVCEASVMFELKFVHAVHLILQPTFTNFNGGKSARPDAVLWVPSNPKFRVVIECDGFETHGLKDAFSNDRLRDRIFHSLGFQVRRYSGSEIHHQPIAAAFDLTEFLIDQGVTKMKNHQWERRVLKQNNPSIEAIKGWREWYQAEAQR
jgi:very-short-patch-repair endonuclease